MRLPQLLMSKNGWKRDFRLLTLQVAEGNGPVNALAKALFRALLPTFPTLENVVLSDYKVSNLK